MAAQPRRTAQDPMRRMLPWLVPLLLIGGICLSTAWDADGSIATSNLPQATLEASPSLGRTEHSYSDGPDPSTPEASTKPFLPTMRHQVRVILERLWRPIAIPARGP